MGSLGNIATHKTEIPRRDHLIPTLRWWVRLCFGIGLPLAQPRYGFKVKCLTFSLFLRTLAVGLIVLSAINLDPLQRVSFSTAFQLSGSLFHHNNFILTAILHAAVVWKLKESRALLHELNQCIIVDLKLKKILQISMALMILSVIISEIPTVLIAAIPNAQLLNLSPSWTKFIWATYFASSIYPTVITCTITLLITALGYQFSLIKEVIKRDTLISWEKLYQHHIILCKMIRQLQKCFDLPLTILIGCSQVNICLTVFYLTEELLTEITLAIAIFSFSLLDYCVRCILLCVSADYLTDQANSLALDLADADSKYLHTIHTKEIVRAFSINVRNLRHLTSLSVGGFCRLGKPLLLTMSAVAMTYFVLLRQMRATESVIPANCTKNLNDSTHF